MVARQALRQRLLVSLSGPCSRLGSALQPPTPRDGQGGVVKGFHDGRARRAVGLLVGLASGSHRLIDVNIDATQLVL